MSKTNSLWVAFCLLAATQVFAEGIEACSTRADGNRNTTATSIRLRGPVSTQNFYYRLGHFVAFVSAEDIQKQIATQSAVTGLELDASLSREIAKDATGSDQVDLFKYVLVNPRFLQRIEFLMARSLDAGVLSVVDVWGRPRAESIRVVKKYAYTTPDLKKRVYCGPDQELILEVTDLIA